MSLRVFSLKGVGAFAVPVRALSRKNITGDIVSNVLCHGLLVVLELVSLRGERKFKPHPQNRILVSLSGEKHYKSHPQNRILVPLRGEKHFKPHTQNRILEHLRISFQNFRRAPLSFNMGAPSELLQDNNCQLIFEPFLIHVLFLLSF